MVSIESQGYEPKIIVFACNWCSYAAADLAGLNHLEYPAEVRIIRTPCSGRMVNATMVVAITTTAAVIP